MEDRLKDLYAKLHELTVQELIEQIEAEDTPAAILSVARQLLRDNGVGASSSASPGLHKLADIVPFPSKEELAS